MGRISVSLSDDDIALVRDAIASGDYEDESDFVSEMVRRQRVAQEDLIRALDRGLKSGVSELTFDQIIDRARERARSRAT